MKRLFYTFLLCLPCWLISCGGSDDTLGDDENPPVVIPPDEKPVDSRFLYNGIHLPEKWPPVRSSSSDLERGMSPFYLSDKPSVIHISVGRQLFVDDFLIESTNLIRTFYYPEYYSGNPILSPDKDWEKTGTKGAAFAAPFSDGIWYDETERKYKMWYMAGGGSYTTSGAGVTCYAESTDGINWTKPILSTVAGTNIVDYNSERDASVIWLDKQESNTSRKYKMFLVARKDGKWRYHYKTSSDGKVWRASTQSEPVADRSAVYKNPFRNVWIYSMRHNVRVNDSKLVRARDYNEHTDPVIGTKKAEALLSSFWFGPWPGEQRHSEYPDIEPAIYNLDATPYESIMLGFFSVWQGPENDVCASDNVIKRNQIMVGYSRDGYSWLREDMNPFHAVNSNSPEAWNQGNLQSVAGAPLIVGDKLYFYLSGRRLQGTQEITTTGLAMLRRDGFVSMKGTGELRTPLLKFDGSHFFVNLNVTGEMRVELLDSDNKVIEGFSKDECKPLKGNHVKAKVEWSGNTSLVSLKDKQIKVKFYVDNGEIFAFWISPSINGESMGYTAGGGPGLNITGIDKTN